VLTYYRRHPQRARTRLLDLLGEVLTPPSASPAPPGAPADTGAGRPPAPRPGSLPASRAEDPHTLWLRTQTGVAPLKRRR